MSEPTKLYTEEGERLYDFDYEEGLASQLTDEQMEQASASLLALMRGDAGAET